ncbi:fungal specific transcription factor domain-containing protein [Aspergillus alliaceus]|uniref:fungal specific transcription factor domain-containing protein n=1 Tax=Petromyces alliaceus TaxID=209559 RepID=UPI0012A52887|nr:fungal-specific transcription factor domain-containing protein [Aspergillus alliaceus]KAB8239016.1 fungal-specific transcription factor domain-containing protein [Aspergillus alliaceus]
MPVLDLQEFFDSIRQTQNSDPVSLILLQAILFAGCAFVDMPLLERTGYQTRRDARKAFYVKVKYLYELDWEPDPIPVIQALLLITYWFESPEDQKDPWYWLGVCRLLANRIGLGRNQKSVRSPPKSWRLSRRLWWLCILQDRVIAIATRKPLQFKEENINMPLLTLEDFETQPIDTGIASLRDSAFLNDAVIRQTLARLCIEKTKLGLLIARILTQNYTLSSISESPVSSVMLYSPNHPLTNLSMNISIRRNLEEWRNSLPDDCVFPAPSTYARQQDPDDRVLLLHRAVLRMFSLMAFGLFYRPLLSANRDPLYEAHFPRCDVKRTVTDVADETARMAELFYERNMVQKLPPYATTFFISALPTFIVQINSRTEALCDNPRFQFRWCSQAIFQQRDIWPTADHAYALIQAMVSKAQLQDDQGLIPEGLSSEDTGSDTVFPSRELVLPVSATSMLIPDGNMNVVGVLPENIENGAAWLEFNAIFNQYCNSVEAYPAG